MWVLAGGIWAVVLAEPAASPPAQPVAPARRLTLYDELALVLAERRAQADAASRSAAAPAPVVVWPAVGPLTGWFGERRGDHRHPGIDIDGATGGAVVAATAGRVVHAGAEPAGYQGYGTVVLVNHGSGLLGIYAHLSKVHVRRGQQVAAGELLGAIGTSGNVTGSHLHFELRRRGVPIDPKRWLAGR